MFLGVLSVVTMTTRCGKGSYSRWRDEQMNKNIPLPLLCFPSYWKGNRQLVLLHSFFLVCSTGGKGPCRSTGVPYELVCQLCRQKYIGETSRSVYTRGKEHLRALEQREQSSVMWRHSCEKHDGSVPGFKMNVTGMFQSDAMLRQISESIQINKVQQDQLINTKSGWSYFRIPKAVVTQSWDEATNILSYDYCTVILNSSILLLLLKTFLWETWRWRPRLHNEWLLLFCQFYFSVIVM